MHALICKPLAMLHMHVCEKKSASAQDKFAEHAARAGTCMKTVAAAGRTLASAVSRCSRLWRTAGISPLASSPAASFPGVRGTVVQFHTALSPGLFDVFWETGTAELKQLGRPGMVPLRCSDSKLLLLRRLDFTFVHDIGQQQVAHHWHILPQRQVRRPLVHHRHLPMAASTRCQSCHEPALCCPCAVLPPMRCYILDV